MSSAFRLFIAMLGLAPLFLMSDSLLARGFLTASVALLVFIVALSIRPGEASFLSRIMRPALIVAALPAVWILIQALPLPLQSLQHPIWTSAQTALGKTLWGSISISPGAAAIALARYLTAFGLFLVAAAVSIDRQRAETLLFWVAGIATALAALRIIHDLGGFLFLGEISSIGRRATLTAGAVLGTILTAALALFAIERRETRGSRTDFSSYFFVVTFASAISGFVVCWLAILFFMSKAAMFAALTGVGTFVLIVGFRRLGLGPRMGFVLAAVAVIVPVSLIAHDLWATSPDLTLRFDTEEGRSVINLTQRIIADTTWLGSGAGAFRALLPIYSQTSNGLNVSVAPTTAAETLVDLGRPALWLITIAGMGAIVWLIQGALARGRDSFYAAAGASCAVVLLIEAYFDASLLTSTTIVLATAALGLALAQSVGRTTRPTS